MSQKKITKLARGLRKSHTDAESLLWKYLRTRQMEGVKFRRQQPIGKYIVDFVSFEKRIVIEVDGGLVVSIQKKLIKKEINGSIMKGLKC